MAINFDIRSAKNQQDPVVVENFLPEDIFKKIQKFVMEQSESNYTTPENTKWGEALYNVTDKLGSKVTIKLPYHISYFDPLHPGSSGTMSDIPPLDELFKYVFDYMNLTKNSIKSYTSGIYKYKSGCGFLMHRDTIGPQFDNRYGITLYLNDVWHPDWGGETIVYKDKHENIFDSGGYLNMDNNFEVDKTYYPKRNRLLVVDGQIHQVKPNLNENIDRMTIQIFIGVKTGKRTKPIISK